MLISGLWFISIWGVGGVLHFMLDVPRALTLVAAIAVATAVWILLARHDAWLESTRVSVRATSTYRAESPVRASAPPTPRAVADAAIGSPGQDGCTAAESRPAFA